MDEVKDEDKDCKDKVEKENENKRKDKNEAWVEKRAKTVRFLKYIKRRTIFVSDTSFWTFIKT